MPEGIRRVNVADCVDFLAAEIDRSGFDSTILVGHSIGGLLLPGAASRRALKVRHLVFVAASVPPEGGRAIDVLPLGDRLLNRLALVMQKLGVSPPREALERMIREHFCNASSEDVLREVLSHPVLHEPACLAFERVSRRGMPPVPRTYLRLLADGTASVETQDRMAANLGEAAVRSVDADHMVMLSQPEALARLLNDVAASVVGAGAPAATGRGEG
jgi:pimeloyl-ACP methyl ester carboxylesterase